MGLVLRVRSSFLLDPTVNISPKDHFQKVSPCRHRSHAWDLGLGTHVKWEVSHSMLSTAEIAGIDLK
jgi:hypothetical protein